MAKHVPPTGPETVDATVGLSHPPGNRGAPPRDAPSSGMETVAEPSPFSADREPPTEPARRNDGPVRGQFGDYELLEEIARGGMGVVFKARQARLNRIVALKMILGGRLASGEDIERFYAEAEAAASLDHPGIVPIYEVGEHDGQHFFSMGHVEGPSLAARIAEGPLAPRDAAELLARVADAVDYAHERGVIHRDLKPGNILLSQVETRESRDESREQSNRAPAADRPLSTLDGPLSTPRVTDFGLAKRIEADSRLTATGQVLGTPGYMPPEQAAGDMSRVDARSDVYSLGAVLYSTLTGRPPFQAASVVETLRQVLEREPAPPRQLNPAVDRDLETICLKCLAKEPQRRYATARELADDLRRFLRHEPILARPVSRIEAIWRWCRRNPGIAVPTAALLVSLLAGMAATSYFAVEASQQAREARREADRAGRLFDEGRRLARWVVFEFTDDVGRLRGSTQAQAELTAQISGYLDRLSQQAGDDQALAAEIAAAYERVAAVQGDPNYFNLGRTSEALTTYRKALGVREKIVERNPGDLDARLRWIALRGQIADMLATTGETVAAGEAYQELLDELAGLEQEHPDERRVRLLRIPLLARVADLHAGRGDLRAALRGQQAALELAEKLLGADPADAAHRTIVAAAHSRVGQAWQALGDLPAARRHYEFALERAEGAAADDRLDREAERQLVEALVAYGDLLSEEGESQRALDGYERAIGLLRRHRQSDPNTPTIARQLAVALERAATMRQVLEDVEGMRADLAEALELVLGLAESNPDDVENQRNVWVVRGKYGAALLMAGALDPAESQFREQLAVARELVERHPEGVTHLQGVAEAWDNLGTVNVLRAGSDAGAEDLVNSYREAVRYFDESLAAFERMAAIAPLSPSQQKLRDAVEAKRSTVRDALAQLTQREL